MPLLVGHFRVTFVTHSDILPLMKSIAIRDLRSRPRQVRKTIATEPQSLLTANGKPIALIIPVDSDTLDDTVDALRIGRAQTALRALRSEAREAGRDRLAMDEIDAVIAKSRRQRTARSSRAGRG
jgi:antitoxin (DNA-binding transcriptional repressor) of toxin-antitoxin stability system